MDTRFWISGVVSFVLMMAVGFVVHGMLLHDDYLQTKLFRSPEASQAYFPYMLLAHILMGFAFAWIYRQGISPGESWVSQGIRFGIAVSLLMTIPMYLIYYAVQPMPGMLVAKQIVFDIIAVLITALVVAFINKTRVQATMPNKSV